MNKAGLISFIKNDNKDKLNKQIASACKAYDYLKKHKHKRHKNGNQSYMINNCVCFCTYMDLRCGILEFMPLSMNDNIGTQWAGDTLRLVF